MDFFFNFSQIIIDYWITYIYIVNRLFLYKYAFQDDMNLGLVFEV